MGASVGALVSLDASIRNNVRSIRTPRARGPILAVLVQALPRGEIMTAKLATVEVSGRRVASWVVLDGAAAICETWSAHNASVFLRHGFVVLPIGEYLASLNKAQS